MDNRTAQSLLHSRVRLQHLRMLEMLDRHRTVRGAAEALGMTQPAVSKALQELEELIDTQLFERSAQGVQPTPLCEPLLRLARDINAEAEVAFEAMHAVARGERGGVVAGAAPGRPVELLCRAVAGLKRAQERLVVRVVEASSDEIAARLASAELDFAIAQQTPRACEGDATFEPFASESLELVARPQHPLLQLERAGLDEVLRYPWLLPPASSSMRERLQLMFHGLGAFGPRDVLEVEPSATSFQLLLDSDRVAVLDATTAARLRGYGVCEVVSSSLPLPTLTFGLLRRRRHVLGSAGYLLVQEIKRCVSDGGAELEAARELRRLRSV